MGAKNTKENSTENLSPNKRPLPEKQKPKKNIVVPIREEYLERGADCHLFGEKIRSNKVVITILQFTDRQAEVCQMLQSLNHLSRAYCIKNNSLQGQIIPNPDYFKNLSIHGRSVVRQLEKERYERKLKTGSDTLEIGFVQGMYKGEFNRDMQAHGEGTFKNQFGHTYTGTFVRNKRDGFCTFTDAVGMKAIGEVKENAWDGKVSIYQTDGVTKNLEIDRGMCIGRGSVYQPEYAYFGYKKPDEE